LRSCAACFLNWMEKRKSFFCKSLTKSQDKLRPGSQSTETM
jgi:hypothetical protein